MFRSLMNIMLLCLPTGILAQNIDSLLAAKIPLKAPYIVINFTSSDCMMCRAGAVNIINKFDKSEFSNRIILLSDDRDMAIYFKQNPEIYGKYKKVYDSTISGMLAGEKFFSTACLIQRSGITHVLLNKIDDETLSYFKKVMEDPVGKDPSINVFVDSLINSEIPVVSYDSDFYLLFNRQFQFALQYDINKNRLNYIEPTVNDTTIQNIYSIIRNGIADSLTDARTSQKILKYSGMPQVIINNVENRVGGSIFFRLNTVFNRPMTDDTVTNYGVRGREFIAVGSSNTDSVLDLNKYSEFIWLDTLHYQGKILMPEAIFNYEIFEGHYYALFYECDAHGARIKPLSENVVAFTRSKSGKEHISKVYSLGEYDKGQVNLFFRIDDRGAPIVVDNLNKVVRCIAKNEEISFADLCQNFGDSLIQIMDISENNDMIKFVGTTKSNAKVKGTYNISNKDAKTGVIEDAVLFSGFRIYGSSIFAYRKNKNTNELSFCRFPF